LRKDWVRTERCDSAEVGGDGDEEVGTDMRGWRQNVVTIGMGKRSEGVIEECG